MGEVVPIRSTEEAMAHAKDWMREAQWELERAEGYKLLYMTYKLRLKMAKLEIARLAALVE